MRLTWVALLATLFIGCGSSYRPPQLPATESPAGPLGEVWDIDVELPDLQLFEADLPGVSFELTLELDGSWYVKIAARAQYGNAHVPMGTFEIEDLST